MDRADLSRLSDVDFEAVVADLYESLLGVRFELFAPGADEGIDVRHYMGGKRIVIQCKHWMKTSGAKLVKEVVDNELPKIKRLRPTQYILVTSADLSVAQKDTLFEKLQPYVVDKGDIVGARDLIKDLNKHPDVVRRHLRLWLSSDEVLRAAVQRPTAVRSAALLDEIRDAVRVWVDVTSRERAREILDDRHVVVIAGIPGIGKSTLARVLCAEYAEHEKYEIVDISQDIDEANGFWSDGRQLFYFDDFLGQTTVREKLGHNADSRLVRFMRRVEKDSTKRLVLTTREYILADAKRNHENLDREPFDLWTCVVPLSDYTPELRARLLYNHVYFSGLDVSAKRAFAHLDVALPVVTHRNFNPRLLDAAIVQAVRLRSTGADAVKLVNALFDDPASLWEHIVRNQLDDDTRGLLVLLAVLPTPIGWDELNECYRSFRNGLPDRALERAVRATEGNLTITRSAQGETTVALHNPSILDFMTEEVGTSEFAVRDLLVTTQKFEILYGLWRLSENPALGTELRRHVDLIINAATRTFESPPLQNSWGTVRLDKATRVDWADRAALLAPMARDLDRHEIWELLARAIDSAEPFDHQWPEIAAIVSRGGNAIAVEAVYRLLERAGRHVAEAKHPDSADLATLVETINAMDPDAVPDEARSVIARSVKAIIEGAGQDPERISDELEHLAYVVVDGRWPEIDQDASEFLAFGRQHPSFAARRPPKVVQAHVDSTPAIARILSALGDAGS